MKKINTKAFKVQTNTIIKLAAFSTKTVELEHVLPVEIMTGRFLLVPKAELQGCNLFSLKNFAIFFIL